MADCVFCRIIRKEIPSQIVYEDANFVAFRDLNPVAPVHILIVPRTHIQDILELAEHPQGSAILSALPLVVKAIARQEGLRSGFRLINNCGADGGQTVPHLHFHLIGGERLGEKLR